MSFLLKGKKKRSRQSKGKGDAELEDGGQSDNDDVSDNVRTISFNLSSLNVFLMRWKFFSKPKAIIQTLTS